MSMKMTLSLICGLLVFIMFVAFFEYTRRSRATISKRMRYYAEGAEAGESLPQEAEETNLGDRLMEIVRGIAKKLRSIRRAEGLDLKMQQAGLPILGSEYLVMAFFGAVLAGVVTMLLTMNPMTAVLVGVGAVFAEWAYILWRIEHRRKAFVNQLGDCLVTVANAMRAGFSFLQAMEIVAKEMPPPISEEFGRTIHEMNLGARMEDVMEEMDRRVGSPDFSLVVTAVLIQRQVGGNLSQILDTISDTINDRIRMRREVLALTAQGRFSGWILAALPFAVAAALSFMNPGYLNPLFENEIGRMAVVGAIVLILIGFFVIQRIVDIEI